MMRLAIVGAGPAGFMLFNRLVESGRDDLQIDIFEASSRLGSGMPYSEAGALREHVTNVSSDELPELSQMLDEYIVGLPDETLNEFGIEREKFHEKRVVPRLLFGRYLGSQFEKQRLNAVARGMSVVLHLNVKVVDVKDLKQTEEMSVTTSQGEEFVFDHVTVCTGHQWEKIHEGDVPGYFDSPYPPGKIAKRFNHKVVVRGSSLTAVDAIKTTANNNGRFFWENGRYKYERDANSPDFRLEMHSRDGLLPSVRVHMEEPHVNSSSLIPQAELDANMQANEGFLSLDFLFERGFIQPLAETAPAFHKHVSKMNIEEFVDEMMSYRENMPAFELLKKEYAQSLQSIRDEEAVPWKEMLGSLSFAMNYPAKHLSAEDMLRLRKRLLPLISVVIAFMPQSSCETLLALHEAGCLELITDGEGGSVEVNGEGQIVYITKNPDKESICPTFIDCIGQRHYNVDDFPFKSLVVDNTICGARLKFKDAQAAMELIAEGNKDVICEAGVYYLKVPGVSINDQFSAVDRLNKPHGRLSLMAVPHIGGFNPDFSGLDFCEQASKRIVQALIA